MNIDWDGLTEELSDTPRARLQQALDMADEMISVLVIYELKTDSHLETSGGYVAGLAAGAGSMSLLGLAEWGKAQLIAGMPMRERE